MRMLIGSSLYGKLSTPINTWHPRRRAKAHSQFLQEPSTPNRPLLSHSPQILGVNFIPQHLPGRRAPLAILIPRSRTGIKHQLNWRLMSQLSSTACTIHKVLFPSVPLLQVPRQNHGPSLSMSPDLISKARVSPCECSLATSPRSRKTGLWAADVRARSLSSLHHAKEMDHMQRSLHTTKSIWRETCLTMGSILRMLRLWRSGWRVISIGVCRK